MDTKQKAINSSKWVTSSTIISTTLQFLQIAIIARLIEPSAFGLVNISTMIITFFSTFSNLGFSNSIISMQEEDPKKLSTIYYTNILLGIIIFLLIFLSTPLLVDYFNEPRLERVIKLASSFFLIVYFGQIFTIILEKELKFKSIGIIDIIGTVFGTLLTIILAYNGHQELSLIYGQLISQIIKTAFQIFFGLKLFKPLVYFNIKNIKAHIQFGAYNLGDGLLGFIQGNSDNIVIASVLGVKALGYYTIASQLAVLPITRLNPIILRVAYPMIAKIKDSVIELKKSYLQILDLVTYFNLPLLAGIFITAPSLVPLVYGLGWEPTIPIIKILVFVSFLICLGHPLFTLVYSKGKPKLLFFLNVFTFIVKIPLVYYGGKNYGITGVAVCYLISMILNAIANFFIVKSLIGPFLKTFIYNVFKPILFCSIMVIVIYCYQIFIGFEGWFNTIIQILIGGIIFMLLTLKYKYSLEDIKSFKRA